MSLLLVLTLFGFLFWRTIRTAPTPAPNVSVSLLSKAARPINDVRYAVPVTVKNTGNIALEEVQVRVTATGADGKPSDTDFSFNYLAEGATETAFVVLQTAPETAKPAARVTGFKAGGAARGY